jgi:cubilin
MSVTERCTSLLVTAIIVGVTFTATVEGQVVCENSSLVASDVEQYITSPGYPIAYPNGTGCQWSISANSSSRVVVLNVLDFELELKYPSCKFDNVTVYDGPNTSSPIIKLLCDEFPATQFISTGPYMTVTFYSDAFNVLRGFQLEYSSLEKSAICTNVSLTASGTLQFITLAGYPNHYLNLMDCQWNITADSPSSVVVLKLLDFSLEASSWCIKDSVHIYDGPSTNSSTIQELCGLVPTTQLTSSGSSLLVTFHSDLSGYNKGFRLYYTSLEKSALCTNVPLLATENANYITSPNYPGMYPSNMDCHWRISADSPSRVVVLKLTDFVFTGFQPPCDRDYVAIYDGYSTSSPQIKTLCGNVPSTQFRSTGPFLTVVFHSDGTIGDKGFRLQYNSQEKSDLCRNVALTATENVNFITSPGYPNNYQDNMDCQWTVTASSPSGVVVLNMLDFQLEGTSPACTFDFVAIYDGLNTSSPRIQILCGQVSGSQFPSTGRALTVVFHSDDGTNLKGFKFGFNSKEPALCTNVNLTATGAGQFITSPEYPSNYPSNTSCQWTIAAESFSQVVVLKVLDFELDGPTPTCTSDYVAIYDGLSVSIPRAQLLCGQVSSAQFTSTGRTMTVVFHSDGNNTFKGGFKIEYTSGLCANATLVATNNADYITSPGYPNDYPSTSSCQWTISADSPTRVVVLKVLDFKLEGFSPACTYDYVAVYDGNSTSSPRTQLFCGEVSSQQVISTGRFLTVVFHSDDISNYRGFKLEYSSQESAACVNVDLPANGTQKYITSPGYPNNYPRNMGCQWKISADSPSRVVVLNVLDFELEDSTPSCPFDYVTIYNGPSASSPRIQLLCGHQESATQFKSTGPFMTVVFRSDGAINFKGFRLGYTSQ